MILSPGRTEMISSSESEDEQQSFRGLAFKMHKKKMEEESKKAKTKENAEKAKVASFYPFYPLPCLSASRFFIIRIN